MILLFRYFWWFSGNLVHEDLLLTSNVAIAHLHLLIISMEYLIAKYNLDARLAITVHDEIRYLVSREHRYKAAMALQVANLWTRAMFSQQIGIDDLPQSCAFFSAVDIDHVLRKEVNMDCVTPSHPEKIPHGESLDIQELLAKGEEASLAASPSTGLQLTTMPSEEVATRDDTRLTEGRRGRCVWRNKSGGEPGRGCPR